MNQITIEFHRSGDSWRADMRELPASPPVGFGSTKAEAVIDLMRCLASTIGGPDEMTWAEKYLEDYQGCKTR